jgi:hypothetical protein
MEDLKRRAQPEWFHLPPAARQALAPHFPDFNLEQIRIHLTIPLHVKLFAVINPAAYTAGNHIHFAPGAYDAASIAGLALIAHEITHCLQYKKYGKVQFQLLYLMHYLANKKRGMSDAQAYEEIPFEIEARAKEREVFERLNAESRSQLETR